MKAVLVGLVLLPVHLAFAQDKANPNAALGGGQHLSPAQWNALPTPAGYSFATGVIGFSSQYATAGWSAADAVGFPNVYPRHGDLTGAWAPGSTTSSREVLSLSFSGASTQEIWIFQTFGVGGLHEVYDISNGGSVLLWRGMPGPVAADARVLRITLSAPRPISGLQLVVNPASVGSFPEIDAVSIVPTLAGALLQP